MPHAAHNHPSRSSYRGRTIKRRSLAGYIAWLPGKQTEGIDLSLEDGCYEHPVVILSPLAREDGKVVVLLMTSFGNKDLKNRHKTPRMRQRYLPVSPCPIHPDNGRLLRLNNSSLALQKNTYINTETQHCISVVSLYPYRRNPNVDSSDEYILLDSSYQELIKYARYEAAPADVYRALLFSIHDGPHTHEYIVASRSTASTTYQPAVSRGSSRWSGLGIPDSPPTYAQACQPVQARAAGRTVPSSYRQPVARLQNEPYNLEDRRPHIARPVPSRPTYRNYGAISSSRAAMPSARSGFSYAGEARRRDSQAATLWTVLGALFSVAVVALLAYVIYMGACWSLWALGTAISWVKHLLSLSIGAVQDTIEYFTRTISNAGTACLTMSKNLPGVVADAAKSAVANMAEDVEITVAAIKDWLLGLVGQ